MKSPDKYPPAPSSLSLEAKAFWRVVVRKWELHEGELALLRQACEALDALRAAEALVRTEGMVVRDRFGQPKPHPATTIVRDSRGQIVRALRALGLKDEAQLKAVKRPGRPPASYPKPVA